MSNSDQPLLWPGKQEDLKEFFDLAKKGQDILRRYAELHIPRQFAWNVPCNLSPSELKEGEYSTWLALMCEQSISNREFRAKHIEGPTVPGMCQLKLGGIYQQDVFGAAYEAMEAWAPESLVDIAPEERTENQLPVVAKVTIGMGENSYWMRAETGRTIAIPESLMGVIELFVKKIKAKAAYEPVLHSELGSVVGIGDTAQRGKASDEFPLEPSPPSRVV